MWNEIMNNTEENNMWNFDELFAEGNVVGVKGKHDEDIIIYVINDENVVSWNDFKNDDLDCHYLGEQIEYIVKLDNHGNSIVLFDRQRDMQKPMPELKTGMFVDVIGYNNYDCVIHGCVDTDNNRIIYQKGTYDMIDMLLSCNHSKIVAVYSRSVCCFNHCTNSSIIWIDNDYKKYLENKEK